MTPNNYAESIAYRSGHADHKAGQPIEDNPYRDGQAPDNWRLFQSWEQGWLAAQRGAVLS